MTLLHPDRLFPPERETRAIARALYESVRDAPIVSPHGHCDPAWFASDEAFPDPATLFVKPDHYVFRMLRSQGARLEDLGVPRVDGGPTERDPRAIWRRFAAGYRLFAGTPTRLWLDHAFQTLFGMEERLSPANADAYYDAIDAALARPEFRPRALFDRFGLEVLATTDGALDALEGHARIRASGWAGRVIPTYRPDGVVDPEFEGFRDNLDQLAALTGRDLGDYRGYLDAHRDRRALFMALGARASDHGHPSARTADLARPEADALYARVRSGRASAADAELFRAQMLTEFARMSLEDGLVMQLHPGSRRNHDRALFAAFGRDKGADIPAAIDYVEALRPLLSAVGGEPDLTLIVFTLDETTYSRELAPLAGYYPALKLGPAWWFFDAPDGMRRYRELTTETAGFYNAVGFNDDTRAFLSIPARHDMARRVDCGFLAERVADHRLEEGEAFDLAQDLAHRLARDAYRL